MGSEVIIVPIMFGVFFGIAYLYFTTRNKERLALIEKGVDASIFLKKDSKTAPVWKMFILNSSLLLMSIGLGVFIGAILHYQFGVIEDIAYTGTIFLTSGIGLFVGFNLTRKLENE